MSGRGTKAKEQVNSVVRSILVVLTLAVGAGLGVYGVRLREERDADRDRRAALQSRIALLDGRVRALEDVCVGLREQLAAQSNSVKTAEAGYQEERQTHEPLRRQIEKMLAQKIADDARARKQADERAGLESALEAARQEASALGGETRAQKESIAKLEAARQESTRSAGEVRELLKAAEAKAAALETRSKELESALAEARAAREEAESTRTAQAAELEALRRSLKERPATAPAGAPAPSKPGA